MNRYVFFRHVAIYLFYLLVAVVITYPLITVFSTRLAGHPFSDSYEMIRHIWWVKHALQTGQPLFFQPLMGYPNGMDGMLLWSYPLQSFPAWLFAFVMPLPAAYNLMIFLRLALNGWAAHILAFHLTGRRLAALLSGLVFLTFPTFQGHIGIGHVGLLAVWGVPLYALALIRLRETTNSPLSSLPSPACWGGDLHRRPVAWIILAAIFFMVSAWGSTQIIIFMLMPITALFALALIAQREWMTLRCVVLATLLGGALAAVFAVPLLITTLNAPAITTRLESGVVDYSADLFAVVSPSFYHPLFRLLGWDELSKRVIGVDPFEGAAYIGMLVMLLALFGVWNNRAARWWLLLAIVAWVCSLGPVLKMYYAPVSVDVSGYATYVTLPWAALYNLPLINITRTPGRFNFTVALALAVLAGYGMAQLQQRARRREWLRPLLPLLLLWVVFEYQFWWGESGAEALLPQLPTIPGVVPEPIAALRERDDVRAVFDIPWNHLLAGKEGMWLQTAHQHPIIAGQMTRITPVDPAKLAVLEGTLDPALLDAEGVDILILHKEWDDEKGLDENFVRARLGEPFFEDNWYAAFTAPKSDAAPGFLVVPTRETVIEQFVDSYLYAPSPGTAELRAELAAAGREIVVSLNGVELSRQTVEGESSLQVMLPLDTVDYYTVRLAVNPPCTTNTNPALECAAVILRELELGNFRSQQTPQRLSSTLQGEHSEMGRMFRTMPASSL